MKRISTLIILLTTVAFAYSQQTSYEREPGQLMVQLQPNADDQTLAVLLEDFTSAGLHVDKRLSRRMNIWLLNFEETNNNAEKLLEQIRQNSSVRLAQFNHTVQDREIIPNDPSFTNEWALKNTGQMSGTPGADIKASYAWEITNSGLTANGDTIVIAMVDGGVDLGHSDLHLWKNRLEIPYNGIDDDENGYIDDYNGWNAYMNNGNMQQSDHGTHVAGIATAMGNNGIGITGVAYNTQLMPIAGSGTNEALVVIAYDYVFEMRKRYNETNGAAGAFVVVTNSSFGIDGGDPANYPLWGAIYDSLGSVGVLNVASTANRGWDIDINGDIPTAMTNESIIAVTNTTNTDTRNTQAAWGRNSIDLGAPGTNIYSTRQGDTYGYKTGTSMSSPFVCGSIALMYAAANEATLQLYDENPALVASKFKRYLIASVDTLPSLDGQTVSGGRLNLLNTLEMVVDQPFLTANPPELKLVMLPDYIDSVAIQLTSSNSEYNTYTVEIPDTTDWMYAEVPGGLLLGSNPGTLTAIFNTTGLSLGIHHSSFTVKDYFLNELVIPVQLTVDEDVKTRITNWNGATLTSGPNPFHNEITINYAIERASQISLTVYDINGRYIATLFNGLNTTGAHSLKWNTSAKPGIYLVKLVTGDDVKVMKVVKK